MSKTGYPIIYEQPGKMNLKQLFRDGCRVSDMVRHYVFFLEYITNRVCDREEVMSRKGANAPRHSSSTWGIMVAMDVKGAGLSHLSGDVLTYLKSAGDINNSHYPLSLKRAFVIHSPFWLAGAWKSIKGILPESVHVDILSSHNYLAALREYIDDDQIPPEYGGSSKFKLGEHPFEQELQRLVEEKSTSLESLDDLEEGSSGSVVHSFDSGVPSTDVEAPSPATDFESLDRSSRDFNNEASRAGLHPRRRRAPSPDDERTSTWQAGDELKKQCSDDKKGSHSSSERDIFIVVSAMYALWSAIQGIIETAIPLLVLTPPELGGLGYAPSRSGVALFSSTMVLLWFMRTKFSRAISKLPGKAPMMSFRIGAGAKSVLLLLLATVPKTAR